MVPSPSARTTLAKLRATRPLVHCVTNPVAASLTANALLCLGASPLMAEAEDEMAAVAAVTDALLVNLGMQTATRMAAARAAVATARRRGTPWVLDPVAAGALPSRMALACAMMGDGPRVIKGNASEILALAGGGTGGRGTDATDRAFDALEPARRLATGTGAVVAVTGAVDWVTDGARVVEVRGGHPIMAQVSGLGCVAGAMIAACLTAEPDPLVATSDALALLGLAATGAAATAGGPGSLAVSLLDALYQLDGPQPPS